MMLHFMWWLFSVAGVFCFIDKPKITAAEENMIYLDNSVIRLGVDLNLGGSITHLSSTRDATNMINNYDFGRQVQMSFYSGPIPYEPNGNKAHDSWRFLGWNPIQSGDWAGNRSKVLDYSIEGNQIYIKCIPMHWPLNNVAGECSFEVWIALDSNVVRVKAKLNNRRPDTILYKERSQEMPAVYTVPEFNTLLTYQGANPFTDDTVALINNTNVFNDPIKWSYWQATENWAALVNKDNWGLGVWSPDVQTFCGGFYGDRNAGETGSNAASTGYVSPISTELLDHNIEFDYDYALIVGSVDEIRAFARKQHLEGNIAHYSFDKNRQHFVYENTRDKGWPIKGYLDILLVPEAAIISPFKIMDLTPDSFIELKIACRSSAKKGRVMVRFFGEDDFVTDESLSFKIQGNDKFNIYKIPIGRLAKAGRKITQVKILPGVEGCKKNDRVRIASVKFFLKN